MRFAKFGPIIVFSFLLVTIAGCRNTQKETGQQSQPEKVSAYGITLIRESSPREVANLLIKGLDNDDKNILSKLVAVKYGAEEVEKIFRKYGKKSNISPEKSTALAVSGWMATYAFFEQGQTAITGDKTEGDKAYVYATGRNQTSGANQNLEIRMVREDGWWKIQPGLQQP